MDARFRVAADLEIQVRSEKQARSVEITVINGAWYDGPDTRTRESYNLSQQTARAFASAVTGAAAEL